MSNQAGPPNKIPQPLGTDFFIVFFQLIKNCVKSSFIINIWTNYAAPSFFNISIGIYDISTPALLYNNLLYINIYHKIKTL